MLVVDEAVDEVLEVDVADWLVDEDVVVVVGALVVLLELVVEEAFEVEELVELVLEALEVEEAAEELVFEVELKVELETLDVVGSVVVDDAEVVDAFGARATSYTATAPTPITIMMTSTIATAAMAVRD